jgi:putative oxidoreductase
VLSAVARILVALVFGAAAWGKIADPLKFAEQIQDYRLAPIATTHAIAFILPWLEALAAAGLLLGVCRRECRWLIGGLLVFFLAAKGWSHWQGLNISCGCFGGVLASFDKVLSGPMGFVLNAFLLALLIVDPRLSPPGAPPRPRISVEA